MSPGIGCQTQGVIRDGGQGAAAPASVVQEEDPALQGCSHWDDRQAEEVGRLQREQEQREVTPRRREGVLPRRRRVGEELEFPAPPDWGVEEGEEEEIEAARSSWRLDNSLNVALDNVLQDMALAPESSEQDPHIPLPPASNPVRAPAPAASRGLVTEDGDILSRLNPVIPGPRPAQGLEEDETGFAEIDRVGAEDCAHTVFHAMEEVPFQFRPHWPWPPSSGECWRPLKTAWSRRGL